jgi:Protein of unknown function (DUF1552)
MKSVSISRRHVLRGMGAVLALPWLEAMRSSSAAATAPTTATTSPVRMAVLFMPNGVRPGKWVPQGTGREFQLSEILKPIDSYREQILVCSNLWNRASQPGDGHYVKTAGLLTSTTINKTTGVDLNCNGVSMDQVAAAHVGNQTPIPSLELGVEPVPTGVDGVVGYTRVYGAHISWRGPTKPLAKEIHPRLVYERLLRATRPNGQDAAADRKLLDLVLEDAKRLQANLGANDRRRVDEYLDGVRSVEQRIERLQNADGQVWQPKASIDQAAVPPESIPEKHAEHVRLMLDLMVLAFQADITRISTFMMGNSVSNINFSFLDGVADGFHSLSHHENKEEKLAQYQRIGQWHVEQLAYFLGRLRDCSEGESNVLDNSMVLFGSDLSDGNAHSPHDLPILLAGRAGGRLDVGQHLQFEKETPLANLYVSMLDAFGSPVEKFADSTQPLPGVLKSN